MSSLKKSTAAAVPTPPPTVRDRIIAAEVLLADGLPGVSRRVLAGTDQQQLTDASKATRSRFLRIAAASKRALPEAAAHA
jgi:hypothetical protein